MWTSRETIRQSHKNKRNDTKESTNRKPSVHLINYQMVEIGRDRNGIYSEKQKWIKSFYEFTTT